MYDDDATIALGVAGLIVALIAIISISFFTYQGSQTEATFTVQRAETHCSNSDCKYLIFTQNQDGSAGEVFEDTDAWQFGKWNSSDIYARIKVGHAYRARVAGWRNGFFSSYRNILSVEEDA